LQELKAEIRHEEEYENYWNIKAHKGGKSSVIIGDVRGAEVMISGTMGSVLSLSVYHR
jgi:multisubunit Na+/H+ antiporter MnhB subunit